MSNNNEDRSELTDKIKRAQILAAEREVVGHLRELGLVKNPDGERVEIVVTAKQIKEAIENFEGMALGSKKVLNSETVKASPFLTDMFTVWIHKCEARAQVLRWVIGLDYLPDDAPDAEI